MGLRLDLPVVYRCYVDSSATTIWRQLGLKDWRPWRVVVTIRHEAFGNGSTSLQLYTSQSRRNWYLTLQQKIKSSGYRCFPTYPFTKNAKRRLTAFISNTRAHIMLRCLLIVRKKKWNITGRKPMKFKFTKLDQRFRERRLITLPIYSTNYKRITPHFSNKSI